MPTICVVSGNKGKLQEWKRLLPPGYELESEAIDLEEIQSMDSKEILKDKVERAYKVLNKPVTVEDVSAGLNCLNGLPGPFIKFFEKTLGEGALYKLAKPYDDKSATVKCSMAYFDGKNFLFSEGIINGHVVSVRGDHGFGFDKVFMPNSHSQTFGEMDSSVKDEISHRGHALRSLISQMERLA